MRCRAVGCRAAHLRIDVRGARGVRVCAVLTGVVGVVIAGRGMVQSWVALGNVLGPVRVRVRLKRQITWRYKIVRATIRRARWRSQSTGRTAGLQSYSRRRARGLNGARSLRRCNSQRE